MRHIPGYKADIILPPQTASLIEGQVTKLVEGHNLRIADLQKHLLEEEQLAYKSINLHYRNDHYQVSNKIQKIMREENTNFQKELNSLKDLYK